MEFIILIALVIVIVVALLKGVNININFNYPEVAASTIADNLYDKEGDLKEESDEDYLRDLLKEVHSIFQEEDVKE